MSELRSWTTDSVEETMAVGRQLAAALAPDGALLLIGALGSGKTVLTQGVAEGLGIDPSEIQSPTYTLIHEYDTEGARLVHADLYRLDREGLERLGLEETLAGPGVKVVEWADRLPFGVPAAVGLRLTETGSGRRRIEELDLD